MNGSLELLYRLSHDRAHALQADGLRHQQLHVAGLSSRARLAHWLHRLAERLEPELPEAPRPAYRLR